MQLQPLSLSDKRFPLGRAPGVPIASIEGFSVMPYNTLYTDRSVVLSAQQAAGTAHILPQNANRKAMLIQPPTACKLTLAAGSDAGLLLLGGQSNSFTDDCPMNELFVSGLNAGDTLIIWEA